MMTRLRTHVTYANAMATFAVFAALGGGAYAASGGFVGSGGAVHACVDVHGHLTVLRAGKHCSKHQQPIALSERGRPGSAGVQGQPGARGQQGAQGAQGNQGVQGQAGNDAAFNGATAGGDLQGQYPSPTIGAGKVGSAAIAAGAVGTPQIADGAVTVTKLGLVPVEHTSALDSTSPKTVQIDCPAGKVPIAGGGSVTNGTTALNGVAALSTDGPQYTIVGDAFIVSAYEPIATATNWEVDAFAVCANGT